MTQKLWQQSRKGKLHSLHPAIEKYTVGKDVIYDNILLPYDIQGSLAHAEMLGKIGILSQEEWKKLKKGLEEIQNLWKQGKFEIKNSDEDMHTAIELSLTEKYGDIGKKIHTGRSRNDQIQVVMHLYMKDKLKTISQTLDELITGLTKFKTRYGSLKMPGYSHMQRAMPMTLKMWIETHIVSLRDDKKNIENIAAIIDQNPLGSAAGFGTASLALDRAFTTKKLGFKKIMESELYCQNARTKFASLVVSGLSQIMLTLGKFANDLLLFTTQEFNFFEIDGRIATGSSIMPQKKNFDAMEILRGNVSVILSYEFRLKNLSIPMISGYNRDVQLTKEPLLESFHIAEESLKICCVILEHLTPNKEKMSAALTNEIHSTEKVFELVQKGMTFRDAYRRIKFDANANTNLHKRNSRKVHIPPR